ncbi:helix-turn-helix transcriptional regulator [Magnetofaba australis]|uniref:helix-turn-helix transcriptional regulator n=1 Tax=Magnetofaba australis TaxID=1472297 RepID=UPI0018E91D43|nr:AlpA family transcriptional regulator [Magnetofaba australis]
MPAACCSTPVYADAKQLVIKVLIDFSAVRVLSLKCAEAQGVGTTTGATKMSESQDRILRKPEVRKLTGLSGTTLWRRERAGDFPKSVRLSPNAIGWRRSEVEAWMASLRPAGQ